MKEPGPYVTMGVRRFPRLILFLSIRRPPRSARVPSTTLFRSSGGAGLAAERTAIENQRGETFGTCIDRSSKACRSGAHNGHVVDPVGIDRSHETDATCELVLARIAQQLSARAQHDGQLPGIDV